MKRDANHNTNACRTWVAKILLKWINTLIFPQAWREVWKVALYLLEGIIWFLGMTTSLPVASTCSFWCPKASKSYGWDLLSITAWKFYCGALPLFSFPPVFDFPILYCWMPLINISTCTPYCPSYQCNPSRVTSPFLKHNQQIPSWV